MLSGAVLGAGNVVPLRITLSKAMLPLENWIFTNLSKLTPAIVMVFRPAVRDLAEEVNVFPLATDLNGDGSVDTVDLTFLASHIVGIVGYELPASYENVFDVNQDGGIDTIDLVYLASYIVGVDGYDLNIID